MGFEEELIASGYIHRPLPVHSERSMEQEIKNKDIGKQRILWAGKTGLRYALAEQGDGGEVQTEEGNVIRIRAALMCPCWPDTMPQDGDCAYYGRLHLAFYPQGEDWMGFNRLKIRLKPVCDGVRVITCSLYLVNDGLSKVPDKYGREGFHMCVCENHQWNDCIWEFPSLPRDRVTEFGFLYRLSGKDISCGDNAEFLISSCVLEQVREEKEEGWELPPSLMAFNTAGYETDEKKYAVLHPETEEIRVEDRSGKTVLKQKTEEKQWLGKKYRIAKLSSLGEGEYRICTGAQKGAWFPVNDHIWRELIYKGLNFLFCERCGYPVPGKHGLCHMDTYAKHSGVRISYCGGWHDAGDMSQQTIQTAETTEALLELADAVKDDPSLYQRVMEEALWGLEFVLRTRFGDGYRATSLGLIRYTDGKWDNDDDAANVRVHNHALENFICSAVEALAGERLAKYDPELSWRCMMTAKEDFAFAEEQLRQAGMELPIRWEHTYDAAPVLMYGEICLSASRLYRLTGEIHYKEKAAAYGSLLGQCQETTTVTAGIAGFFYRDERKERILHYSHQSREHVPAAAWRALCQALPEHPEKIIWEQGLLRYGQYLKDLSGYASPYGMFPAGVYDVREAEDKALFMLQHIQADYEEEKINYKKQVEQGVQLTHGFYIRQFPVWFSFRGNTAPVLAMAKAAAVVGNHTEDQELLYLAGRQKDWLLGLNPFCRSIMYGAGERYETLYSVFPGICTGQLPVGIQTKGVSDIPYWPMANNSTYKEVWVNAVGKFLGVAAELYKTRLKV